MTGDIQRFIDTTNVLIHREGRWHAAQTPFSSHLSDEGYTDDALCQLDARLRYVIPALAAHAEQRRRSLFQPEPAGPFLYSSMVQATLAYWNNTQFLTDQSGESIPYRALCSFHHVDAADHVGILYDAFEVAWCKDEKQQEVPYVVATYLGLCIPSEAWLNQTFPGWQQRRAVAEQLGYSDEALMALVFNDSGASISPASLAGVSL